MKLDRNLICKISNVFLSLLYFPLGSFLGLFGILFLFYQGAQILSFPENLMLLPTLLCVAMPFICIFSIVFSVLYRKKEKYSSAFMIQFLPFAVFGMAITIFFCLAIWA